MTNTASRTASTAHTPGPWAFRLRTPPRLITLKRLHWEVGAPAGFGCAIVFGDDDANARLIAAAPVLLSALQDCAEALAFARDKLGMCGEGDGKDRKADVADDIGSLPALYAARAAIAKATGAAP